MNFSWFSRILSGIRSTARSATLPSKSLRHMATRSRSLTSTHKDGRRQFIGTLPSPCTVREAPGSHRRLVESPPDLDPDVAAEQELLGLTF